MMRRWLRGAKVQEFEWLNQRGRVILSISREAGTFIIRLICTSNWFRRRQHLTIERREHRKSPVSSPSQCAAPSSLTSRAIAQVIVQSKSSVTEDIVSFVFH